MREGGPSEHWDQAVFWGPLLWFFSSHRHRLKTAGRHGLKPGRSWTDQGGWDPLGKAPGEPRPRVSGRRRLNPTATRRCGCSWECERMCSPSSHAGSSRPGTPHCGRARVVPTETCVCTAGPPCCRPAPAPFQLRLILWPSLGPPLRTRHFPQPGLPSVLGSVLFDPSSSCSPLCLVLRDWQAVHPPEHTCSWLWCRVDYAASPWASLSLQTQCCGRVSRASQGASWGRNRHFRSTSS